jgi:farnesyl diphosphate synthase
VGQLLDLTSQPNTKKNNLDLFTLDTYKKIVEYKTAYYSFYLPVALALYLGGIATPDNLKASMDILLPMGEYFQIQDDFLDCYGAPEVIGKIGRDIEENKCGWLIVQALPLCNAEQRAVLAEFYGVDDPQAVAKVKQLYAELNITKLFQDFEQESFERISAMITNTTATVPKQVFTDLLAKIYKRSV